MAAGVPRETPACLKSPRWGLRTRRDCGGVSPQPTNCLGCDFFPSGGSADSPLTPYGRCPRTREWLRSAGGSALGSSWPCFHSRPSFALLCAARWARQAPLLAPSRRSSVRHGGVLRSGRGVRTAYARTRTEPLSSVLGLPGDRAMAPGPSVLPSLVGHRSGVLGPAPALCTPFRSRCTLPCVVLKPGMCLSTLSGLLPSSGGGPMRAFPWVNPPWRRSRAPI